MGAQEEILINLRKGNFLEFRASEPTEDVLIVNDITTLSVGEFKNCSPITEPTWIPLEFLRYAVYATKGKVSFIKWNKPIDGRRYSSLIYHIRDYFTNSWKDDIYKCITSKGTYYVGHGILTNHQNQLLVQAMVLVAPTDIHYVPGEDEAVERSILQILDSKVLIDYSVYKAAGEAEKLVKNQLIPAFIENEYKIELCNLKDTAIWDKPIIPRRLEKSRDLCYDVLKENFKALDKMIKH